MRMFIVKSLGDVNGFIFLLLSNRLFLIWPRTVHYSPSQLHKGFSVTLFEDRLFWTEWETNALHSVNKFTGGDYQQLTPSHKVRDMRDG
jgi:hypothetical protein